MGKQNVDLFSFFPIPYLPPVQNDVTRRTVHLATIPIIILYFTNAAVCARTFLFDGNSCVAVYIIRSGKKKVVCRISLSIYISAIV